MHTYIGTIEVGNPLLSLPTTNLFQALEQQVLHRSVILATSVSNNRTNGNPETSIPNNRLVFGDESEKLNLPRRVPKPRHQLHH